MEAVRSAFIAGIAICGLAAVLLSFLPWLTFENRRPDAVVHADNFPVTTADSVQPALFALIAVGAIAAIDGSAAWATSRAPEPTDEEAYDYDEDEEPTEGTEAWA